MEFFFLNQWVAHPLFRCFNISHLIPRLVCLFLKRGADYNAKDKTQKDPISIAVDNANADIVTL